MPEASRSKKNAPAATGNTADLEARLAALRSEIDGILEAMVEQADAEKEEAAKVTEEAKTAADDIGEEVLREARRALKQIHKQAASLEKTLGVQTRSNPLQSLLIAFGLGFIVSLLMTRR